MNFGLGKEIDGLVSGMEEALEAGDTGAAKDTGFRLAALLLQISNEPGDDVEAFFADKRTIKSVFGKEDREERKAQEG